MNKRIFLLFVMILLFIPFLKAETEIIKANTDTELKFLCTLNYAIPSALTEYNITISYPNGTTFISNQATTPLGNGAFSYTTSFNQTGMHRVQMFCYDGTYSFSDEGYYDVTPNGQTATIGTGVFYIGLLVILVIFLIGCVVFFMNFDNLLARVGMIGLGYLLLIAISFVAWNMAKDFLTSSPFLIEMFWVIFLVLIIGLFPLLIGGFAWYLIMLFQIKEINNLMEHGMDEQEAHERVKRKKK
jgi:hypothetical protein